MSVFARLTGDESFKQAKYIVKSKLFFFKVKLSLDNSNGGVTLLTIEIYICNCSSLRETVSLQNGTLSSRSRFMPGFAPQPICLF